MEIRKKNKQKNNRNKVFHSKLNLGKAHDIAVESLDIFRQTVLN